jgi:DNA-binding transcriptional LysR family regulator
MSPRTPDRRPSGAGAGGRGAGKKSGAKGGRSTQKAPRQTAARRPAPTAEPPAAPAPPFRLGAVPGATPGIWIERWRDRHPDTPLELVQLDVARQQTALAAGDVDAVIARLPVDRERWHAIALYDEVPVVVMTADASLSVAERLAASDLAGEVLIVPADDVLDLAATAAAWPVERPRFAPPASTEEAIATVAAGVGISVVPMSLARLHHRKDVTFRELDGGPLAPVGLVWPREDAHPLIDAFVGIVRGRTARSSR